MSSPNADRRVPAFINCTLEILTGELLNVLPPEKTVLEVLENLVGTPELIESCRKLKKRGFRIALDDFRWRQDLEPLVELADFIKVDILQSGKAERRSVVERLERTKIKLLAEKVENREQYGDLLGEGFYLFQGYYFCRPKLIQRRKVASNEITQLQLLMALRQNPIDLHHVGSLVHQDPAILYRLMHLVNSPVSGIRQEVRSVETALIAVGEHRFRQMATLAIARGLNRRNSSEVLRMALVRARFCELAAGLTGRDISEQYLLGLFSMLPAMLDVSMEEAMLRCR